MGKQETPQERYRRSEKGRATKRRYYQSDKGKQSMRKYSTSLKGRGMRQRYRERYYRTEKGRIYLLWARAKRRAATMGIEFTITVNNLVIPDVCPLLETPIKIEDFKNYIDSPSLDRKNPHIGYTKENVWVISSRANMLKNNSTIEELELLTKNMAKHNVGLST